MPEPTKQDRDLSGWKEIASHLGISVRTAQMFEKEQGLPVRRRFGIKAPVLAVASELDVWKDSLRQAKNGPAEGSESATDERIDRRRWLLYGLAVVVSAPGLSLGIAKFLRGKNPHPAAYRVEGATLIVLGGDSRELWRYTFAAPMLEASFKQARGMCVFADLDGDGRIETVFHYLPDNPDNPGGDRSLVCFNSNGKLRWRFIPGKNVTDNRSREFAPPYWVNSFEVLYSHSSAAAQIVVGSNHHWSFPYQVAVLDGKTGAAMSEYWHRGHLLHMVVADIDGDGEPEVLLGGVNDAPEYKQATLVIFDGRRISGASRDPQGAPYFQGMSTGTERGIVFFPRTPISKDAEFNIVAAVRVAVGRITVIVAEGISSLEPSIVYELDHNMRVVHVALSDIIQNRYRELQGLGKLPVESPDVIAERLKKEVKVIQASAG